MQKQCSLEIGKKDPCKAQHVELYTASDGKNSAEKLLFEFQCV